MPKRILVVDDNGSVRSHIRGLLETHTSYEVCGEAHDGVDAIKKATELRPDLVLLDLAMPRMNGAEAASVLKNKMPKVRVIIFTMYDNVVGSALSAAVGADIVLSKPDGWTKLVESVEKLLPA